MSTEDCNNNCLTAESLIQELEVIDHEMKIVIRCQDVDFFDIDISETYDPVLGQAILVLEVMG